MLFRTKGASENIILLRRFAPFMKGSGRKYAGSILAIVVSVLTSFLTPLLIAGAVDAITDTLNGNGANPVNLPGFLARFCDARGGAGWLAGHLWALAALLMLLRRPLGEALRAVLRRTDAHIGCRITVPPAVSFAAADPAHFTLFSHSASLNPTST